MDYNKRNVKQHSHRLLSGKINNQEQKNYQNFSNGEQNWGNSPQIQQQLTEQKQGIKFMLQNIKNNQQRTDVRDQQIQEYQKRIELLENIIKERNTTKDKNQELKQLLLNQEEYLRRIAQQFQIKGQQQQTNQLNKYITKQPSISSLDPPLSIENPNNMDKSQTQFLFQAQNLQGNQQEVNQSEMQQNKFLPNQSSQIKIEILDEIVHLYNKNCKQENYNEITRIGQIVQLNFVKQQLQIQETKIQEIDQSLQLNCAKCGKPLDNQIKTKCCVYHEECLIQQINNFITENQSEIRCSCENNAINPSILLQLSDKQQALNLIDKLFNIIKKQNQDKE